MDRSKDKTIANNNILYNVIRVGLTASQLYTAHIDWTKVVLRGEAPCTPKRARAVTTLSRARTAFVFLTLPPPARRTEPKQDSAAGHISHTGGIQPRPYFASAHDEHSRLGQQDEILHLFV